MATRPTAESIRRNGESLYLQLAKIIRAQIESGKYRPGDCLPSEEQMARDFAVSVITMREARGLLVREGLIWRGSGKGTFVTQRPKPITYRAARSMDDLCVPGGGVEQVVSGPHHTTHREGISRKVIWANAQIAELLSIPPKTKAKVVELQVRTYVDDLRLGHVVSYVPFEVGKHIALKDLEAKPLGFLISDVRNIRISEADQWTSAAAASQQIADLLDISVGDPVLVIQRVFYNQNRTAVQASINTFRADRFRQHVRLHWASSESFPLLAEHRDSAQRYDVQ